MEWNDKSTLKFIEMYRDRILLWDSRDSGYKNKFKRHDALTEIAIAFGIDKDEVEKKIKNLQSYFSRELKKETASEENGPGEPYVSKWFAYPYLLFLADKNKPLRTAKKRPNKEIDSDINTPVSEEALNLIRSIQSQDHRDEYSLYGEQIAIKMRKLGSPRVRFMAQNAINKVLFEAEMGMFDEDDAIQAHSHYSPATSQSSILSLSAPET